MAQVNEGSTEFGGGGGHLAQCAHSATIWVVVVLETHTL